MLMKICDNVTRTKDQQTGFTVHATLKAKDL